MHTSNTNDTHGIARRRLRTGSVHALAIAGTSVVHLMLAVPVRAHDDAPLPYPEPLEASPRLAPEVVQGPPTMLYLGIGVVGVALMLSLLVLSQRRRARQSLASQTDDE